MENKKCAKCEEVKSIDSFGKVKGKTKSYCKKCCSQYQVERVRNDFLVRMLKNI